MLDSLGLSFFVAVVVVVVVVDSSRDLLEAVADSEGSIIIEESFGHRIGKRQNRITFIDLKLTLEDEINANP